MVKSILEYQKKDAKLVAIEREIAESPAKKVVNQMVEYVKAAQQKLVVLERSASTLIAEFEELRAQFDQNTKLAESMVKKKYEDLSEDELRESAQDAVQINAAILSIEKNIAALSKKISSTLKEFEKTKEQGVQAKKKYAQGMQQYNNFVSGRQSVMDKLKEELKELEKQTPPELMKKYKTMREDKKFPVFVPLLNGGCAGCSMQLPRARLDILKREGMLECENCRRIIYQDE